MSYENSSARKSIEKFIDRIGQGTAGHMGGDAPLAPSEDDRKFVLSQFNDQQKNNGKLIYLAAVILVLIFGFGVFLVFHFLGEPKTMLLVLGGHFFSLLIIVVWLRKLWLEKSTLESLLTIVSGLSPSEAARILLDFHFRSLKLESPIAAK